MVEYLSSFIFVLCKIIATWERLGKFLLSETIKTNSVSNLKRNGFSIRELVEIEKNKNKTQWNCQD